MIDVELTIRNYRCFGGAPIRLRIADGFTALVGTNNSGKSSLLRLLFEIRSLLVLLSHSHGTQNLHFFNGGSVPQNLWDPNLPAGERIFRAGIDRGIEFEFIVRDGPKGRFAPEGSQLVVVINYDRRGGTTTSIKLEDGQVLSDASRSLGKTPEFFESFTSAMGELPRAMYIGPFRNAINVGGQGAYYDIDIGENFIRSFAEYKSGPSPERNEAVFSLMQEIKRIFGFESLDINPVIDYKVLQLIVDGQSYRLAEQGAGLAHFIVVLINVLVKRPSLLLIDEPELNLHASLQLDFLQTLTSYTKYGVVFATHSLGLARTAADRIYTMAKPVGGTSTMRPYEGDRELVTLLGQLSFDRRPDLGFSKALLVEGKTELRALMQFLRLYGKEHEVLMLPLHGDEMIGDDVEQELAELLRIGGDVHYLIDSERTAQGEPLKEKRQGFVDLCAKLGIAGHVLERRALENYFTDAALKRAFGANVEALAPYMKYEKRGANQNWPKTNNWRAAALMTRQDLDGTDLGDFLAQM